MKTKNSLTPVSNFGQMHEGSLQADYVWECMR